MTSSFNSSTTTTTPSLSLELSIENPLEAGELSVRNEPEEINRLLIQTEEYSSRTFVKTQLEQVSYGRYHGKEAALIVFSSQFFYPGRNRVKGGAISVLLSDATTPKDPKQAPTIVRIAPIWVKGQETTQNVSSGVSSEIQFGHQSAGVGLTSKIENMTEKQQARSVQIKGFIASFHARKHPTVMNRVRWSIEESAADKAGIPLFFRGAMLVQCERAFEMTLEMELRQGFRGLAYDFIESQRGVVMTLFCSCRGSP